MTAYEYGQRAFENGIISAPVLDAEFKKTLQYNNHPVLMQQYIDWARGWHEANVASDDCVWLADL